MNTNTDTPTPITTGPDLGNIKAFMQAWGTNENHMAEAIGMSEQNMSNMLSGKHANDFTPQQLHDMVHYLRKMRDTLTALVDIRS